MKFVSIIIYLLFITVIEATVFSFPLTLLAIVALGISEVEKKYTIGFISGIVMDLFVVRSLGMHSVIFLIVLFLLHVFHKKIAAHAFYYLLPSSFLLIIGYNFLLFGKFTIVHTIGSVIFGLFSFICCYIFLIFLSNSKKLRV